MELVSETSIYVFLCPKPSDSFRTQTHGACGTRTDQMKPNLCNSFSYINEGVESIFIFFFARPAEKWAGATSVSVLIMSGFES